MYSPFYLMYKVKYKILDYHTSTSVNPIAAFYCVLDLSSKTSSGKANFFYNVYNLIGYMIWHILCADIRPLYKIRTEVLSFIYRPTRSVSVLSLMEGNYMKDFSVT
jgi:hypothetical protein